MGLASSGAWARLASAASLVLAVALLAGCGSGGGRDSTPSTSVQPPSAATTLPSNSDHGGNSSSLQSPANNQSEHRKPPPDLLPPTPGSKAAAPGVPTSRYGDNSIQTWGLEASDAERKAATKIVQTYLAARATREWRRACSDLAAKALAEQRRLGSGARCPAVMRVLASQATAATLTEEAEIDSLSLRVGRHYAFLIFRRLDGIFATSLAREFGTWKILSVTPSPLG